MSEDVTPDDIATLFDGSGFDVRCAHDECTWKIVSEDVIIEDPEFVHEILLDHEHDRGHADFEIDARIELRGFVDKTVEKTFEVTVSNNDN